MNTNTGMDIASIGDGVTTLYEFEWDDMTRSTEEIGDLEEAGFSCGISDIVDVARADDECTVRIIGFQEK
jgi:hypothetical protein